jgi:hypothetical protein
MLRLWHELRLWRWDVVDLPCVFLSFSPRLLFSRGVLFLGSDALACDKPLL